MTNIAIAAMLSRIITALSSIITHLLKPRKAVGRLRIFPDRLNRQLSFENPTMTDITTAQALTLEVTYSNSVTGQLAAVENIAWTLEPTDAGTLTIITTAQGNTQADFIPNPLLAAPVAASITITADGDLGEGVRPIVNFAPIGIVPAGANIGTVNSVVRDL